MALGWLRWRAWVPVDAVDAAALCVAGVWHLARHGRAICVADAALMALGWLWWRAWVAVDVVDAAAVCMAGVALGDIGTWRHRPSLCVAGVALGDIDLHFAWQAWHL